MLKHKIIGGLPLGRFYPELADCMLLCATEMTKRADMDHSRSARDVAQPSWRCGDGGRGMIKKTRPHITQNEPLLFEPVRRARRPTSFPNSMCRRSMPSEALGAENVRDEIEGFPEVSEVEAIRHFTRLSTWNYAIDLGMYPLGSCTMKYNPRINETGGADRRPRLGASVSAGGAVAGLRWRSWRALEDALAEITGMDAVTLQPAAGAHGELTGILLIRALLERSGNPRKKILIPDSAHGTNPATAAIAGYAVENIKSQRPRRASISARWSSSSTRTSPA